MDDSLAERIIINGLNASTPQEREAAVLALAHEAADNPNEERLRKTHEALMRFVAKHK